MEEPEESFGIDFDLQEELVSRQKWENYCFEGGAEEIFGSYSDLIENVEHSLFLKRPNGSPENCSSFVARNQEGVPVSLNVFEGVSGSPEGMEEVVADFKKFTRACPFTSELLSVTKEGSSLVMAYELDGGAISMAEAIQASVTSGGFISGSKDGEEALMEQWVAQLLWTLRLFHIDAGWFLGAGLLSSPQNILLTSQSSRIFINGVGSIQVLALARSPLPYTEAEIEAQQTQDLKGLLDLLKSFLSGPRRWLLRSPLLSPILAYLDQRSSAFTSLQGLLELPAVTNLFQRLFVKSIKRQKYLEDQMMIQIQSERVLGLLCKLNFVVDRFKSDDSLRTWPARNPLLGLHQFIFGRKNLPGVPDMDLMHAVGVMRQLDIGSEERLLLSVAENSTCFSASFAELAYFLEEAYLALSV